MIINTENLKKIFEEDGYLYLKNFFNKAEVNTFIDECDKKFYISDINMSPEITSNKNLIKIFYNKKFTDLISEISNNKAAYFGCGSLIGHVDNNRITWRRLHTDTRGNKDNVYGRTYYDPSIKNWPIFDAYIYLEDFENYSGCLKVVKGSHKKFLPTVGNFIKIFFNISKNYKFNGKYSLKSVPLFNLFKMKNLKTQPGDLVIFNHAIHHSPNSLILKFFPNLSLPVFIENVIEKYFKSIYKPFSKQRRIISIPFAVNSNDEGYDSGDITCFIKSRAKYVSEKFFENSQFYLNEDFRDHLKKCGISSNTSLQSFVREKS